MTGVFPWPGNVTSGCSLNSPSAPTCSAVTPRVAVAMPPFVAGEVPFPCAPPAALPAVAGAAFAAVDGVFAAAAAAAAAGMVMELVLLLATFLATDIAAPMRVPSDSG